MPIFHDQVERPPSRPETLRDTDGDFDNVHMHHVRRAWASDRGVPQSPMPEDNEEVRPLSREALIHRIKRGGSPAWSYSFGSGRRSPERLSTRNSRLLGSSSTLLPAVELQESSESNTEEMIDHRLAGMEIERPRSALHSGDFRENKDGQGMNRGPSAAPLSTSPVAPWHDNFPVFRAQRGLPSQPTSRLRSTTQSSLSNVVLMPPTSPLVQATYNPDLDFSPRPLLSRRSGSPQKDNRRHTFSPQSLQTYNRSFYSSSPTNSRPIPTARRENTFPCQAHQPRRSITPFSKSFSQSSPQTPLIRPRRLSITSESSPLHHAPMVGSYEESILRGRMSTTPSRPLDFVAQIGVLGRGNCKSSLRCPSHVTVPFPAVFYSYSGMGSRLIDDQPSPYVGLIDLENDISLAKDTRAEGRKRKRYGSPAPELNCNKRDFSPVVMPQPGSEEWAMKRRKEKLKQRSQSPKAPPGGCYRIPQQGQLQIVIKNPNKTAVKLYLVPYDLSDMEPGQKTFIRQRSYSAGPIIDMPTHVRTNFGTDRPEAAISSSEDPNDRPVLRYLIHLHICCTGKGRFYLYKSIRVVFANRVPDGKEKLRNEIQLPEPKYSAYKTVRDSVGIPSNAATFSLSSAQTLAAARSTRRMSTPTNFSFDQADLEDYDNMSTSVSQSRFSRMSEFGAIGPIPFSLDRLETVQSRPTSREMMDTNNVFRKQAISTRSEDDNWVSSTSACSNPNTTRLANDDDVGLRAKSPENGGAFAAQGLITRQLRDLSVERSIETTWKAEARTLP